MLAEEWQCRRTEGTGRLGAIAATGPVGPVVGSVVDGKPLDLDTGRDEYVAEGKALGDRYDFVARSVSGHDWRGCWMVVADGAGRGEGVNPGVRAYQASHLVAAVQPLGAKIGRTGAERDRSDAVLAGRRPLRDKEWAQPGMHAGSTIAFVPAATVHEQHHRTGDGRGRRSQDVKQEATRAIGPVRQPAREQRLTGFLIFHIG
jgi:hypothetical protein